MGAGTQINEPRFEEGKTLTIAGLQQTYTIQTRPDIPALWQSFVPFIGNIENQVPGFVYGVILPADANGRFDYMAGAEVSSTERLPPQFTTLILPASRYAVFAHEGLVSELSQTLDAIWREWMPKSGVQPVRAPSLERYPQKFNPTTDRSGVEVWIPVNSKDDPGGNGCS